MNAANLIVGFSPAEFAIYGFIAANVLLSGTFLIQRGVKRLTGARAE